MSENRTSNHEVLKINGSISTPDGIKHYVSAESVATLLREWLSAWHLGRQETGLYERTEQSVRALEQP